MPTPTTDDARLAAEIERLKAEFPKTRDLYREVCALLFFRFGITPTANRLYQLVHRGSMSTPTAVLTEFWADLREKSRVRIEHPDLPDEVRQAAAELVATLWSRATDAANTALDALRSEVETERREAQQSVVALQADLARTETALEQRTSALLTAQVRIHELEQSLAAAEATRAALDEELMPLRQQARDRDATLAQAQAEHKRATLEVERERAANARLQRDAEKTAQTLADARAELQALHKQLGDLRHRNGTLEGQLDAMRETNAAYARELNAWRDRTVSTSASLGEGHAKSRDAVAKGAGTVADAPAGKVAAKVATKRAKQSATTTSATSTTGTASTKRAKPGGGRTTARNAKSGGSGPRSRS
jgi:hypothetical protein